MVKAEPGTKGAMLTSTGEYAIPAIDAYVSLKDKTLNVLMLLSPHIIQMYFSQSLRAVGARCDVTKCVILMHHIVDSLPSLVSCFCPLQKMDDSGTLCKIGN